MAKELGVSRRSVERYRTQGMPMESVNSAKVWLRRRGWGNEDKQADELSIPDRLKLAQIRKLEVESDIKELRREQIKKTLLSQEDVEAEMSEFLKHIKLFLANFPEKIAMLVDEKSRNSVLAGCRRIINEFENTMNENHREAVE